MKPLAQVIAGKKFDYVNDDIVKHFSATEVPENTEYKLYHFNKNMTSEEVIEVIKKDGYCPANISELLEWKEWNKKDCVVGLGSVAEVYGSRRVPCLYEVGSGRRLDLRWFGNNWGPTVRFLAIHNSQTLSTQKSDLSTNALQGS